MCCKTGCIRTILRVFLNKICSDLCNLPKLRLVGIQKQLLHFQYLNISYGYHSLFIF